MRHIKPLTVLLLFIIALLIYSNYRAVRDVHPIPLANASLVIPKNCEARPWGNALEVDCPSGPWIYYAQKLKEKSPR